MRKGQIVSAKKIRTRIKRVHLFSRIVFRVWDEQDGEVIRLSPRLSWEVAGIIHNEREVALGNRG